MLIPPVDQSRYRPRKRTGNMRAGYGFTLIELIVAGIIAALLTMATTFTVSRAAEARTVARGRQQAQVRSGAAAARISREAADILRDVDPAAVMVHIRNHDTSDFEGRRYPDDELLLFSHSLRRARPDSDFPEGDEYETQFRIIREDGLPPVLWERRDPVIDEVVDGGGVAMPVAGHILGLDVKAYDGGDWYNTWDSDTLGLPLGLRIEVIAESDDGRAVVRRRVVVSFDRTPLPVSVSGALEELLGIPAEGGQQ